MTVNLLVALALLSAPEKPIPVGTGKLAVEVGGQRIGLYTYKPKEYREGPLIVVFHGMLRNADEYRDNARGMGDRFGALVVAPEFDSKRFPHDAYQLGGVQVKGKVQPRGKWTVGLVGKLVEEVRRREGRPGMPYYLIGHSAGGQFLARLAGFVETDARRVVLANPGSHLFPTRDLPAPYGFGGLPRELGSDSALKRYLAQPVTIYLGTADTGSENLPQAQSARKQGKTRYERGLNCFRAAEKLAKANGWAFNWRLVEAPKVGHDNKLMFDHKNVAEALFGKARRPPEEDGSGK
jgi:poly(3-hydroxybutyrate) depolymerase